MSPELREHPTTNSVLASYGTTIFEVMSRLARARDLLRKMWLERAGEGAVL